MNYELAKFSTDLRRISYWIYNGNNDLVKKFISKARSIYKIAPSQGSYKDIWKEIEKIEKLDGGRIKAADRASTLSSIMFQEAFK